MHLSFCIIFFFSYHVVDLAPGIIIIQMRRNSIVTIINKIVTHLLVNVKVIMLEIVILVIVAVIDLEVPQQQLV